MKIQVTLKDPDGFYECVRDAVNDSVKAMGLTDTAEQVALESVRLNAVWDTLERWVEYKEYLLVTFDLDAMTATVETRQP